MTYLNIVKDESCHNQLNTSVWTSATPWAVLFSGFLTKLLEILPTKIIDGQNDGQKIINSHYDLLVGSYCSMIAFL